MPPPGLYPDPQGSGFLRHWTGHEWGNITQEPVVRAAPPTPQATQQAIPPNWPYPGPAPKKRRAWPWVLGTLLVLFVAGVGGCALLVAGTGKAIDDAVKESEQKDQEAFNEVQLNGEGSGCKTNDAGWMEAFGTINNTSSKASNYFIEVRFLDDSGVQLTTGLAAVNQVAPGSTANWQAFSFKESPGDGHFRCEVADVKRTAS